MTLKARKFFRRDTIMSKKTIKDENGKTYTVKEKKPFYKKWWFWVLIVIIVIGFASCSNNSSSSKDSSSNNINDNKTEKVTHKNTTDHVDIDKQVFKIGQTASYDNMDVKVNSVKSANSIGDETPDDGNQYVIVNVTLKNNGSESQDYNDLDFKFDNNGDIKDSTTVSSDNNEMNSGELDKGATITKDVIGEVPSNINVSSLKLVYEPDFFNNTKIHFQLQ